MISLLISIYCSNWLLPEQCENKVISCIEKNIQQGEIEEVFYQCVDEIEGGGYERP